MDELPRGTVKFKWDFSLPQRVAGGSLRAHLSGDRTRVYVCGGDVTDVLANHHVDIFCLLRRKWIRHIQTPVVFFGSAVMKGELVIIGGLNSETHEYTKSLHTLLEGLGKWVKILPPMPTKSRSPAAVAHGDIKLVVAGGFDEHNEPTPLVEVLDLNTNQWQTTTPLPSPLGAPSGVYCQGHFYILGGVCNEATTELQEWDNLAFRCPEDMLSPWLKIAPMPYVGIAAVAFNNVLVIGGKAMDSNNISKEIRCYIHDEKKWKKIGAIQTARYNCSAVVLPHLQLMVVGGRTEPNPNSACDVVEIATLHGRVDVV